MADYGDLADTSSLSHSEGQVMSKIFGGCVVFIGKIHLIKILFDQLQKHSG